MKIKNYKNIIDSYVRRFNDVRFLGQIVFVVIVLLISWSGIKSIQTNYNLQKQITTIKQQNELQKLQNENLGLQNQYYNSKQYLELSARQNFGLADPGEKEIIVPASVAMGYTINVPMVSSQSVAVARQSAQQHNVESWINFFLHRTQNTNN
jgi:cell division protein FtsB